VITIFLSDNNFQSRKALALKSFMSYKLRELKKLDDEEKGIKIIFRHVRTRGLAKLKRENNINLEALGANRVNVISEVHKIKILNSMRC
jgi:hypothetical protein